MVSDAGYARRAAHSLVRLAKKMLLSLITYNNLNNKIDLRCTCTISGLVGFQHRFVTACESAKQCNLLDH